VKTLAAFLLLTASLCAQPLVTRTNSVSWDDPGGEVAGYNLCMTTNRTPTVLLSTNGALNYVSIVNRTNTRLSFATLIPPSTPFGIYSVSAQAVKINGEASDWTNLVFYFVPSPPSNLRVIPNPTF
jgi:hypothetical protein